MKTFLYSLKLFFKTPSVIVPYLILFGLNNVVLYKLYHAFLPANPALLSETASDFYFFLDIEFLSIILFIVYIFIGYEYMRKANDVNMIECIKYRCGKVRVVWGSQFLALFLMSIVVSANIGVYFILGLENLNHCGMPVKDVISLFVWNVLVLSLSALSVGTIISKINNRIIGYAFLIMVSGLTIPQLRGFWNELQEMYRIPIFYFIDLFNNLPNNFLYVPDPLYGLCVEGFRKFAMILDFAVMGCIFVLPECRKGITRIILSAGTVSIAIICVFNIYHKGSVLVSGDAPYSSLEEVARYYSEIENSKEEKAEFRIVKYDMEFTLDKELEAVVDMVIQESTDIEELKFTLYHGYNILCVSDGNNPIEYNRTGDYLTLKCKAAGPKKIHMEYVGSSSMFYSNKRAAFLPQMFAFYPKAGFQSIYNNNRNLSACRDEKAGYNVIVHGPDSVSNIEGKDNYFAGEACGFTLIAGNYEVMKKDKNRVIEYPIDKNSLDVYKILDSNELHDDLHEINSFLGTEVKIDNTEKTFISIPNNIVFNSNMKSYYDCEECIYMSNSVTAWDLLEAELDKHGGKSYLKDVLVTIKPSKETELTDSLYSEDEEFAEQEYTEDMQVYDLYITKMRQFGVQKVSREVVAYLLDDKNQVDELTFLNSIKN